MNSRSERINVTAIGCSPGWRAESGADTVWKTSKLHMDQGLRPTADQAHVGLRRWSIFGPEIPPVLISSQRGAMASENCALGSRDAAASQECEPGVRARSASQECEPGVRARSLCVLDGISKWSVWSRASTCRLMRPQGCQHRVPSCSMCSWSPWNRRGTDGLWPLDGSRRTWFDYSRKFGLIWLGRRRGIPASPSLIQTFRQKAL